jgi:hypothetical protein
MNGLVIFEISKSRIDRRLAPFRRQAIRMMA